MKTGFKKNVKKIMDFCAAIFLFIGLSILFEHFMQDGIPAAIFFSFLVTAGICAVISAIFPNETKEG